MSQGPNTSNWIKKLEKAEKTCIIQDGRRKIHFTFEDKTEMAEEYNIKTGELMVRKWRKKNTLGATLPWEFEVGTGVEAAKNKFDDKIDMVESSSNPILVRQDTLNAFQWRIRNLVYPLENYILEISEQDNSIVVKTHNKKYYKKMRIPDLDRVQMRLDSKNLSYTHANNTLVITYTKPDEFVKMEKLIMAELSKTKASKDGDVECNPS